MNKKSVLKKSLELFELEKIDRDIFSWNGKNVGYKRIFGGQVMAQTLIAAYKTIDVEHFAHSYHSYFLRPGDMDKSITFTVDRIRDGKSFTTRSVKAIQEGEVIFNCSISFQKREKGLEHQIEMPDVPEPESLKSEQEIREEILKELKMKKEDMPPGTGDAQLTMSQRVPLAGAVIVSTPQDIALLDARKGLNMFKKVNVPVLGIVENMSTFVCPKCGEPSDIFGSGGAKQEALRLGVDFLGGIPLHMDIRITSDEGKPVVLDSPNSHHSKSYKEIASAVWRNVSRQRKTPPLIVGP